MGKNQNLLDIKMNKIFTHPVSHDDLLNRLKKDFKINIGKKSQKTITKKRRKKRPTKRKSKKRMS
jgi:hypothetical protein